jgi:GAF domain-containing protein/HD domain-containing protein
VALQKGNFRRLLKTVEALSDLGPALTAERDFTEAARAMLSALMQAATAREAVLFTFTDKPSLLTSVAASGFALIPEPAVIPLLPKHVHALTVAREPVLLHGGSSDSYLSANGNVAPELFKCLAPLHVAGKLVGVVAFGRREDDAAFAPEELEALELLGSYVALAIHNYSLSQTLAQRVAENLRLLASLHGFYDNALEAFAAAIDVKHVNIHGHSLRVGRYAAAIGESMGMEPTEIVALRSAAYLHDIGKVAVDKRLFGKPGDGGSHHRGPSDCKRRTVPLAANSGHRAFPSRTRRWLGLSGWAVPGRCSHERPHRRPGRHLRCYDQRAALSPTPVSGRHSE